MKYLLPLLAVLLLAGCASKPPMYYYGSYETAYYHAKKDQNAKSADAYRKSLEDIIDHSSKNNMRVPPGIYCEYAYLLAKSGDKRSEMYFDLEVKTYPESEKFVTLLKSQLKQSPS